jgi:hypothetical protein
MIEISRQVSIPDEELEITAIRAQGAGGQHVNKASTAIHLRFDIRASSLPEFYKEKLLAATHHLLTADGRYHQGAGVPQPGNESRSGDCPAGGVNQGTDGGAKKPSGHPSNTGIERAASGRKSAEIFCKSATREGSSPTGVTDEIRTVHKEERVNKAIVSLAVAMTLFALMGCNNRGEVETVSPCGLKSSSQCNRAGAVFCRAQIVKASKPHCSLKKMAPG